jgi:hypothetical protein
MAEITTTSLGELLKRLYANWEIEQQVNLTYPVLAECAREGTAQLGGSGFYFPVRTSAAEGHKYMAETDALPVGQQSTVRQALVSPTVHVGVVTLTGLSVAVSSGSAMAFARAFDENIGQTVEAMSAYKEGCLFRSGDGTLATTTEAGDGSDAQEISCDDVGFLRSGMVVDFLDDTAGYVIETDKEIAAVDWVNKTITLAAGNSITAAITIGATIHMASEYSGGSAPAAGIEPIGLPTMLSTSTEYLGISRTTYPNWQGNAIAVSGFFDEAVLLRGRTQITQQTGIRLAGISSRMACLCHPMQADILFKLAIPRIRYSGNEAFDLGNSSEVSFGNIDFKTSYLCPPNVAYLGDWSYCQSLYTPNGKLHVDTEYNGSALKWVSTLDQGLVFLKEYCAFANKRPNSFMQFTSLTEASR